MLDITHWILWIEKDSRQERRRRKVEEGDVRKAEGEGGGHK
jgi:hypothetical protein